MLVLSLYTCVLDIMQVGQWLADGCYAVVWGLLGDHDYKRDCLGLPNVLSHNCCPSCPADTSKQPWFDFRLSAKWISMIYKACDKSYPCKLLTIQGVSVLTIWGDWMHDKPLGTDKVHPLFCAKGLS